MPFKTRQFGIKIWALANAMMKYIYNFEVFRGVTVKNSLCNSKQEEAKTSYDVCSLMRDLFERNHIIFTDNFFTSRKLLVDLETMDTYACSTLKSTQVGILKCLLGKKKFSKFPQRTSQI